MTRPWLLLLLLLVACGGGASGEVTSGHVASVGRERPLQPTTSPAIGPPTSLPALPAPTVPVLTAVPAIVTAASTAQPTMTVATATNTPAIARYLAYSWGNNLSAGTPDKEVAQALCSSAQEITAYNHIAAGALTPQRPVIVPMYDGCIPKVTGERLLIERGSGSGHPRVALTLDAGASAAPTPKMLDALRERNIHITFFLTGQWMRENPELLRQIVADGHEVGNHSVHHQDFTKLDDATILDELYQTEALAQSIAHTSTRPFFRPPFGAYNKHVLGVVIGAGYLPIYWTVDSLDSVGQIKSPAFLLERVTHHLPTEQLNGAIFLMHCGSAPSAVALPQILDRFAAMGVEVTTISHVLGQ